MSFRLMQCRFFHLFLLLLLQVVKSVTEKNYVRLLVYALCDWVNLSVPEKSIIPTYLRTIREVFWHILSYQCLRQFKTHVLRKSWV